MSHTVASSTTSPRHSSSAARHTKSDAASEQRGRVQQRVPLADARLLAQLGDEPDLVAVQIGELEELNDPFKAL